MYIICNIDHDLEMLVQRVGHYGNGGHCNLLRYDTSVKIELKDHGKGLKI